MKIVVDLPACQAYGLCVMEAPEYFAINEDADKVAVLKMQVADEDAVIVEAAERACPMLVISLERS
jgi:ferredoxin